jgi:hypothetical protein
MVRSKLYFRCRDCKKYFRSSPDSPEYSPVEDVDGDIVAAKLSDKIITYATCDDCYHADTWQRGDI